MHLFSSRWFQFGALGVVGLLLFGGFAAREQSPAVSPLVEPLPQDPQIQVYFNQSQAATYTDPYRNQTRAGDDLERVMVEAIASAQSSVDLAVQELRLPKVAQALAERHQAGIQVRVVIEHDYSRPWSSVDPQAAGQLDERDRSKYLDFVQLADQNQDGQLSAAEISQRDALVILQMAQVPVIDDMADGSKGSDLMHHKFAIIDNRVVVTGSANMTVSGTHGDVRSPESRGNVNHLVKISSPEVAQLFAQEFSILWGDGPGGQPDSRFGLQKPHRAAHTITLAPNSTVTVQFSPTSNALPWEQSVNGLIGRALSTATQSADLALFVFSDQTLANILESRHQQGIQVRALIDPGFAFRNYSEGLDMMGVAIADNQCRYEQNNQPWRNLVTTVGVPPLPEGDVLHHKFGLVDSRLVITGSQNWSEAANSGNDENLLVIDNPTVAAHFDREFERLYATASLGVPGFIQEKIQQQQTQCRP